MTGATAFLTAADSGPTTLFQREAFSSLFPRRDAFIWKTYDQERWQKAVGPLLDAQILGVVSDEGRGLYRGCYWSHKTRHAVLDLDIGSRYHNETELQKLQAHLAAVGLYGIPYQSSDSGGWHLYLPFEEWAESDEVNQTLKTWLKTLGYEIASGQLEIFPSGNALRLPLQKGFGWLAPDGSIEVRREEIREDEALASFLQDFEENSRNWQNAKTLIESQIQSAGSHAGAGAQEHEKVISLAGFDDLFRKGKIQETWDKGREHWLYGLTAKGQRHDAVMAVGHYLWYGDPSENVPAYPGRRNDETRARLIEAWLKKKHNGFCRHINLEQWKEIEAHIWRTVFWRRGKNYEARKPYPLTDRLLKRLLEVYAKTGRLYEVDRMAEANNARLEDARNRIKKAIQELLAEDVVLTKSEIARKAGCNRRTISKHSDLLAIWPSVYNRGVWGDFSGSVVPEVGFEEKEKSEIPPCSDLDLANRELEDSKTASVAPLTICPANSQPSNPQRKDQALRVVEQVFTPGPWFDGIRAEGQMGAEGISSISRNQAPGLVCYTDATVSGTKEKTGAATKTSALPFFGAKNKNRKTATKPINYKFLTTGNQGYSSGFADEFSLIEKTAKSLRGPPSF
ncbi:MAG: hypothetical protein DKT66_28505 [Candidatus Melainabacteria bacterium]|nr:MAG: hypothetical protein DKT66_28505 [Candidatus Melainabacteria bacterium]